MWSEEKSKIARRCGEKHILKSKCTKHSILGALLEVEMLKHPHPLRGGDLQKCTVHLGRFGTSKMYRYI